MPSRVFACALTLVCIVTAPAPAQSPADRALAADVDSFVQRLMTISGTPGLGVAVVQGNRPILVKGYGYSDVERRIPVTENTVFYVASMTKAFTALTVALMAERRQIELDAPVSRYLRDAQWAPGISPDSITIRQLLTHTHGISGDGPVVWRTAWTGEHTNAELKALLRHHGPGSVPRGTYRYTNLGYNIAGLIIDDLTRGRWQDALATNVMTPLGMSSTTPFVSRFDSTRLAMPYALEQRLRYGKLDANMQAAGGLVSSAADMAKWLEVQINGGRLGGRQVFPASVIAETQRQQVVARGSSGEFPLVGYTLGWMVGVVGGDTVLMHGGGFSTFRAFIVFDPRRQIGIALLTNESIMGGGAIQVMARYVLERARDGAQVKEQYAGRLAELPAMLDGIRARVAEGRAERARRPQTLNRPLDAYTGTFESPTGGVMTWTVRSGRLWATIGVLESVAEVYDAQADQLRVELEPGFGTVVEFRFADGRATSLRHPSGEYVRR
jgi:CubicO group peptidase (beta-lactamase class C family)